MKLSKDKIVKITRHYATEADSFSGQPIAVTITQESSANLKEFKSLAFSYPTSENATRFWASLPKAERQPTLGVWSVRLRLDGCQETTVASFVTRKEAVAFANAGTMARIGWCPYYLASTLNEATGAALLENGPPRFEVIS